MAAGFTIDINKIKEFKEFVFRKFRSVNIDLEEKKNYYYDAEIAPSAVNLEFFEKINLLAPFGSGNPEPRFIIKDLKLVNSKIVAEKHIKIVLIGSDTTTLKAISFNSVETQLGYHLLKNVNRTPGLLPFRGGRRGRRGGWCSTRCSSCSG